VSHFNQQVYAVSNLDTVASDLIYTFVNYFVSKFPNGAIDNNSIFVDYLGRVTDHKRTTVGGLVNPRRIKQPILYFIFDGGLTDPWDKEDKPDVYQYSMFPGTTNDRRLKNNHRLVFLNDPDVGIILDTIEIRRKLDLQMKIDFATKGDLETCKSFMYNTFEIKKNNYLRNMKTSFVLPNIMVNDISKLAFNANNPENAISNPRFQETLRRYMNQHVWIDSHGQPMYTFDLKQYDADKPENRSVYFIASRYNTLSWRMNEFDGKSGANANKNGDSYDHFMLEFQMTADLKLPNSYVMNYKVFNAPNKMIVGDNYLKAHRTETDKKGFVSINNLEKYYIDTRKSIPTLDEGHTLIVREEFFVEEKKEILPLSIFVGMGSIHWTVLERLTPKERAGMYRFDVYEDDYIIDSKHAKLIDVGSDIICELSDCDPDKTFLVYIYVESRLLDKMMDLIMKRIAEGIFPNVDANGNRLLVGSYPPSVADPSDIWKYKEWDPNYFYHLGDICVYDWIVWRALRDTNMRPGREADDWELLMHIWREDGYYCPGDLVLFRLAIYEVVGDACAYGMMPDRDTHFFKFLSMIGDDMTATLANISRPKGDDVKIGRILKANRGIGTIVTWDGYIHCLRNS